MNKIVTICLLNPESGEEIGRIELPLDRLPESFEKPITLHIGGELNEDWEVLRADPVHPSEFGRTGQLTLWGHRFAMISPSKLIMTLPTISDGLPTVEPATLPPDARVLHIRTDDWRQIELISRSHDSEIKSCLAEITNIY